MSIELKAYLYAQVTMIVGAAAKYVVAWLTARTKRLEQ